MANRAYIVLRRNDLDENFLQALDLIPNESQRLPTQETYGQTHYVTNYLLDGVNAAVVTTGAGPITTVGDTYGLSAYLIDHVEGIGVPGALPALTAAQALAASQGIEALAGAGGALTLAGIAAALGVSLSVANTMAAADTLNAADNQVDDYYNGWTIEITGGTGIGQTRTITDYVNATDIITPSAPFAPATDGTSVYLLTPPVGLTVGNSTGAVEDILRILAGERWKLPAGSQVEDAGNLFDPTVSGYFVTAPNRVQPTITGSGGRKSTARVLPEVAPVQTGTQDVNFVWLRHIYNTGDLHRSVLIGALSEMKAATFSFLNPTFTYSAVAPLGTALTLGAVNIAADGVAPAVVVYAADGTVI